MSFANNQFRKASRKNIIIIIVLLLCGYLLFFQVLPKIVIDNYIKNKIISEFKKTSPAYELQISHLHYKLFRNKLIFSSIKLLAVDSSKSASLSIVSVRGISWLKLLKDGKRKREALNTATIYADGVQILFKKTSYLLQCKDIEISLKDSSLDANNIIFHPGLSDPDFFGGSKFRKTRFKLNIPSVKIAGLSYPSQAISEAYSIRSLLIQEAFIDIQVSKYNPLAPRKNDPLMPNEVLSALNKKFNVQNIEISKSKLTYGEQFEKGKPAAKLLFSNIHVLGKDLGNTNLQNKTTLDVNALFYDEGELRFKFSTSLTTPKTIFNYKGSLGKTDITRINAFLIPANHLKIASGDLQKADFEINFDGDMASGTFIPEYRNLKIAMLNKNGDTSKGLKNKIGSFIVNAVKIRNDNIPEKSGSYKTGNAKFQRQPKNTFIQLIWFSLKSAITDAISL